MGKITKIKIQYIISYFGILPFIYISFDIFFINAFSLYLLKDFAILYTLIIFTFIGSMRWSFYKNYHDFKVIYGFLPSFISTILIFLNLLSFNKDIILFFISSFILLQLFVDFFLIKNLVEKFFFIKVRLPSTMIIFINLFYLIFV
tara:strand:+ start:14 stop:451 length:438 start_codon:yes stop_codon:yes gene_type:complete